LVEDPSDKLSFGEGRLGGAPDWKRIEAAAKAEPAFCAYDPANGYADCAYFDGEGVWTAVEGKQIIRKEIGDIRAYSGRPVLGLVGRPMLADALRGLETFGPRRFPWVISPASDGSFGMTSGQCIADSKGERWELFFKFNQRHEITLIGARLNWP